MSNRSDLKAKAVVSQASDEECDCLAGQTEVLPQAEPRIVRDHRVMPAVRGFLICSRKSSIIRSGIHLLQVLDIGDCLLHIHCFVILPQQLTLRVRRAQSS